MFQLRAASNPVEKSSEDAKQTLDDAISETEQVIAGSQDATRELGPNRWPGIVSANY
jgi:hypothetical protein